MTEPSTTPRVFVSHASEDKAIYAEPLARALLARGVDAWYDSWEIGPGDSLVQRIFEQGLAGAHGMVIVLSQNSVDKPWVRAELDHAVVRRIEGSLRLMPVVVDGCPVPESLRAHLWTDLSGGDVEGVATRVANAMFGITDKPPVAPPPAFVQAPRLRASGLTPIDEAVLHALFELAAAGHAALIQPTQVAEALAAHGIDEEALNESVDVLVSRGHLRSKERYRRREGHMVVEMPSRTVLHLAAQAGLDVPAAKRQVAAAFLNEGVEDLDEMVAKTNQGRGLVFGKGVVEAILEQFQTSGFLKIGRTMAHTHFFGGTPSFRRWLEEA